MNTKPTRIVLAALVLVSVSLLLTACGKKLRGLEYERLSKNSIRITSGFQYRNDLRLESATGGGGPMRFSIRVEGVTPEGELSLSGDIPFMISAISPRGDIQSTIPYFVPGATIVFAKAGLGFRNGLFEYTAQQDNAQVVVEEDGVTVTGFDIKPAKK